MTKHLRIGEISYANCTPLYYALKKFRDCSRYEFVHGEPSSLNTLLAQGGVDVSASSSIEYARRWRQYLIVPGVSISSKGAVGSILLFTKKPIEHLSGERVALSTASATSSVLLKALLKKRYGVEASYVPHAPELAGMLDGCAAGLLIGDEALKERMALDGSSGLRVYDLGLLWHEFTGLPFVYALWIIREDSAGRLPILAGRLKEDLLKSRGIAEKSYELIAGDVPEAAWMGRQGLIDYWRAISYSQDEGHIKGLSLFYEMATELGEIPEMPELRFL